MHVHPPSKSTSLSMGSNPAFGIFVFFFAPVVDTRFDPTTSNSFS